MFNDGSRKKRKAATKAEKKLRAITKDQKEGGEVSEFSDISSADDSEDNFDFSKEINCKKMFKLDYDDGNQRYVCLTSTEVLRRSPQWAFNTQTQREKEKLTSRA